MTPTEDISEFSPVSVSEVSRLLAENAAGPRRSIIPVGGGTALQDSPAADAGLRLKMTRLAKIIEYPARDMTITVEAGVGMNELSELLKKERQQLPVDVAQSHRATLGGLLACNSSGSRRYGYGTLRDYLIGVSAVDGQGRPFSAGGRVVKNVAGYDLCKLMIGSLGTLGVITQATLKLKPIPETTGLLWATYDTFLEIDDALQRLLKSDARPVMIDVLNIEAARTVTSDCRRTLPVDRPVLLVGVEGTEKDVAWQMSALTRELAPLGPDELFALDDGDAATVGAALTEFPTESDAPLSFKAGMTPSTTMAFLQWATDHGVVASSHAGNGIVHGHFPDSAATPERADELLTSLRAKAAEGRGHVALTRCPTGILSRVSRWGAPPGDWTLMRTLKTKLDPAGVLNPGRLFDEA